MTSVLLVEKNGTIKSLKIKEFCEEDFYKKCGYKSPSNFKKQHTWKGKVEGTTYYISLFAKTDSRTAMGENKYEFPPPIDQTLFFGNVVVVNKDENNQWSDLTVDEWETIYDKNTFTLRKAFISKLFPGRRLEDLKRNYHLLPDLLAD
jgi:hypothetical protein